MDGSIDITLFACFIDWGKLLTALNIKYFRYIKYKNNYVYEKQCCIY